MDFDSNAKFDDEVAMKKYSEYRRHINFSTISNIDNINLINYAEAVFIFHLEPSKGSDLALFLADRAGAVREKYGADASHLFKSHCSVSGFFAIQIEDVKRKCCVLTTCDTSPSSDISFNDSHSEIFGHNNNSKDSVNALQHHRKIDIIQSHEILRGKIVREVEKHLHGHHEMQFDMQHETSNAKILSLPNGHIIVPLHCESLYLLSRNLKKSLYKSLSDYTIKKYITQSRKDRGVENILRDRQVVKGIYQQKEIEKVILQDKSIFCEEDPIQIKKLNHMSLGCGRRGEVQEGIVSLYNGINQVMDSSSWDFVVYELIGESSSFHISGTHIFSEVHRKENICTAKASYSFP